MNHNRLKKKTYVIIPALNPPQDFYRYLSDLNHVENMHLIVVNDGSGEEYQPLFSKIKSLSKCRVLDHKENRGKGAALKTAFAFLRTDGEEDVQIVCADCDGQHKVQDIICVAKESGLHPGTLILGTRRFSKGNIPWKSKLGNRVSSLLLYLTGGVWVGDTQTGLRAFHCSLLLPLLSIPGQRFEYEMEVLSYCMEHQYPIHMIDIETVYENNNKNTHFRPIQDSFQVLGVVMKPVLKFLCSSFGCGILDLVLFTIIYRCANGNLYMPNARAVLIATVWARTCSVALNYYINRNYVFSGGEKLKKAGIHWAKRYLALCAAITLSSASGVYFFHSLFPISAGMAKIAVDCILFLASYQIQRKWVFSKREVSYEV